LVTECPAALSRLVTTTPERQPHEQSPNHDRTRTGLMNEKKPTVVLVHGAFAESANWNGVID
jgi:hypothetical protein